MIFVQLTQLVLPLSQSEGDIWYTFDTLMLMNEITILACN